VDSFRKGGDILIHKARVDAEKEFVVLTVVEKVGYKCTISFRTFTTKVTLVVNLQENEDVLEIFIPVLILPDFLTADSNVATVGPNVDSLLAKRTWFVVLGEFAIERCILTTPC
jgi:hypothetical protein